ncbi:MAG: hypothetical protein AAFY47_05260, partial [Pseudomonadota bacterium]
MSWAKVTSPAEPLVGAVEISTRAMKCFGEDLMIGRLLIAGDVAEASGLAEAGAANLYEGRGVDAGDILVRAGDTGFPLRRRRDGAVWLESAALPLPTVATPTPVVALPLATGDGLVVTLPAGLPPIRP